MKKTLVSVSDDLKDFCPLTTWQRFKMYWGQIVPFLLVAIVVTALFGGIVSVIHSRYHVAFWAGLIAFCAIILCLPAFASKVPFACIREKIRQRNKDGYWMIYVVNAAGKHHAVFGPKTLAAVGEMLNTLREGEGLYFVVPLFDKRDGFVSIGKRNLNEEVYESMRMELAWWGIVPIHLSTEWSDLGANRIVFKDRYGEVSPGLSIQVVAQFIRSAPIGGLGEDGSNWPMAFKAMMERQERYRKEGAKIAANLDWAIEAMVNVASKLDSNGLTLMLPCEMIAARRPIVECLDRLLSADDPRRGVVDFPPKPLPDIAPAANNPPSPDGAPPASDDDGHCCCSGP